MNHIDKIKQIDEILMSAIVKDIVGGTVLTSTDDETLELVLIGMWENLDAFTEVGVIVGDA